MIRAARRHKLAMLLALLAMAAAAAYGWDIADMLRLAGIPQVVTWFGHELDSAANTVFGSPTLAPPGATKVVPVYSASGRIYVRAVQLYGPKDQVSKVLLAVQVPLVTPQGEVDRFVPSKSPDPAQIDPVPGVSVSAIIDFEQK